MKCVFCKNPNTQELYGLYPFGYWCADCFLKLLQTFREKKEQFLAVEQEIYRNRKRATEMTV